MGGLSALERWGCREVVKVAVLHRLGVEGHNGVYFSFFFFKGSGAPRDLPSSPPRPSPDPQRSTSDSGLPPRPPSEALTGPREAYPRRPAKIESGAPAPLPQGAAALAAEPHIGHCRRAGCADDAEDARDAVRAGDRARAGGHPAAPGLRGLVLVR